MSERNACPYCAHADYTDASAEMVRARHPLHQTMKCADCEKYFVRLVNGNCFPLVKSEDVNSDTLNR